MCSASQDIRDRPVAASFRLVGDRPYVQASQMIARAAERIAGTGNPVLVASAFRRITAETLELVDIGDGYPSVPTAIGSARFRTDAGISAIAFVPTGQPAPRADEVATWTLGPPTHAHDETTAAFAGIATFEHVVEVAVRAVKRWHAALAADVTDIWFTGCRDADLRAPGTATGTIAIVSQRMLKGAEHHQSMTSVALRFADDSVQRATVSFAFRSTTFAA